MKLHPTRHLKLGLVLGASLALAEVCNAAFTLPTDNLTVQLAADSGVNASGGAVTSWNDLQANAGSLVLNAGSTAPVLATESFGNGSHSVVQFGGVDNNFLSTSGIDFTSLVSAQSGAIFVVLRQDGVSDMGSTPVGWGGGNNRLFGQTAWLDTGLHFQFGDPENGGDYTAAGGTAAVANNQWHILSLVRDGQAAAIRLDGVTLQESGSAFSSSSTLVSASQPFSVGASDNNDNFKGAIAEVLIYNNGSLDPATVENYLGEKYGLAPVPEPSEYAMVFGVACILGAIVIRRRKQALAAAA